MDALDFDDGLADTSCVSFPAFQDALETYFGEDAEISSPEDESDAWRSIVDDFRDGSFVGLLRDIQRLLTHSDQEIFEFLRSTAPASACETPADARHSIEDFRSYVEAHSN